MDTDQFRAGKRARFLVDGSEEDYEMEEDIPTAQNDDYLFDDLCGDATFCKEDNTGSEVDIGCWGLLDGLVLARVFHFLRADIKSLVYAALTCKHWRSVSKFFKDICRQADLSSVGPNCTDTMISSILVSLAFIFFFFGLGKFVFVIRNLSIFFNFGV